MLGATMGRLARVAKAGGKNLLNSEDELIFAATIVASDNLMDSEELLFDGELFSGRRMV
uniref:Uncharacterized protein n=1 Tax=Parascaris equorum TaxID=6256 RepID=A0A914SJD4_PAREQ